MLDKLTGLKSGVCVLAQICIFSDCGENLPTFRESGQLPMNRGWRQSGEEGADVECFKMIKCTPRDQC